MAGPGSPRPWLRNSRSFRAWDHQAVPGSSALRALRARRWFRVGFGRRVLVRRSREPVPSRTHPKGMAQPAAAACRRENHWLRQRQLRVPGTSRPEAARRPPRGVVANPDQRSAPAHRPLSLVPSTVAGNPVPGCRRRPRDQVPMRRRPGPGRSIVGRRGRGGWPGSSPVHWCPD